jgi:hypothetical protein
MKDVGHGSVGSAAGPRGLSNDGQLPIDEGGLPDLAALGSSAVRVREFFSEGLGHLK